MIKGIECEYEPRSMTVRHWKKSRNDKWFMSQKKSFLVSIIDELLYNWDVSALKVEGGYNRTTK